MQKIISSQTKRLFSKLGKRKMIREDKIQPKVPDVSSTRYFTRPIDQLAEMPDVTGIIPDGTTTVKYNQGHGSLGDKGAIALPPTFCLNRMDMPAPPLNFGYH